MAGKAVQRNRAGATSLALLLCSMAPSAWAVCPEPSIQWQVALVSATSQWDEFDTLGRKLVHESGTLEGPEMSVGLRCEGWDYRAGAAQLDGPRHYDGQTSTGVPVASHSTLKMQDLNLQAGFNLNEQWQIAGRVSRGLVWRNIASTAGAVGYPERYEWTSAWLGTLWTTATAPHQWVVQAWFGAPLTSSMVADLPGHDRTVLPLGSTRQIELAAAWRMALDAHWHVQADVRYRRIDIDQGRNVVMLRGGIPMGLAHQPKTIEVNMPVAIRLSYSF